MNKKIDGQAIAVEILKQLKAKVKKLKKKPCLAVFSAGQDPASISYIKQKRKAAREIGAQLKHFHFEKTASYQEFAEKLNMVAKSPKYTGLIIQKPLPVTLDHRTLDSIISLEKDVDGTNPKSAFFPPVALAVFYVLEFIRKEGDIKTVLHWKKFPTQFLVNWLDQYSILLIGRGETAGKPIADTFADLKIKFLIAHQGTKNLVQFAKKSDIIISCVGKKIVKKEMVKKSAILIGVGIRRVEERVYRGDFNEEEIKDLVSYYTPTPGGIGPLTVASLMKNLIKAAEQ